MGAGGGGTGDGELAVFERLAEHFEHLALELGQLVQEEDAVTGEAHLAWLGMEPPPMRPASESE